MKILIIHQYYKTPKEGGGIRSYHIAQYLIGIGHKVSVITAYNGDKYKKVTEGDLTLHYLPIYYTNHLSFLSRIHAFVRYIWQSVLLLFKIEKPDLNYVISTPLTTGIIALFAKWKFKTPFIFEVGDLWPDAPIQLNVLKNSILKKTAYWLERKIYNSAQSIVALSPDIAAHIKLKSNTKVDVITNLANVDFFKPTAKQNKPFIIGYIGTAGLANHLTYFLDAAEIVKSDSQIQFKILGAGAQWEEFKQESKRRSLQNIIFYESGGKEKAKSILEECDAVYISFKNVPVLATGSPNKFFDGIAAGKLIIINFGGWLKTLVETSNCGFQYDPEKPTQFLQYLKPYLVDHQALSIAQNNARLLAERDFTIEKQLSKLKTII